MNRRHRKWTILNTICAACLVLAYGAASKAHADVHHNLTIHLDLNQRLLTGIDRMRVTPPEGLDELILNLASRSQIRSVRLDGRSIPYRFDAAARQLRVGALSDWREHLLEIHYSCRFDDPLPHSTLNTDNPGYGISGTITEDGAFILAGAHWYPQSPRDRSMQVSVEAPRGYLAVVSGDLIEHRDLPQQTISRWHCDPIVEALSLVVGPYLHRVRPLNRIGAATYFTAELDHLSPTYLTAAAGYLQLYTDLFGPYAFRQFAVVENFFPTGYGFPGFTLIGGQVLQLPFIPQTSLGHEIAHCWWGNGVLVDSRQGNWAEGLTTYVAEHLYKERASAATAVAQRQEWLRNYASLVPADQDMALSDFIGRIDPVTKTIGYDKSAMLFHMLRRMVGDAVFWRTLRDVYAERRFRETTWSDLQAAFEAHSGKALNAFFTQWLERAGAPQLFLDPIEALRTPEGWTVRGRVRQTKPVYTLLVPLQLSDGSRTMSQTLLLDSLWSDFEFKSQAPPLRFTVDSEADLFRRLAPEELPATVNALRSASRMTIAVAGETGMEAADILQTALGPASTEIAQGHVDPWTADGGLILIGPPADPDRWNAAFPALTFSENHFTLEGRSYPRSQFSFFGVFTVNRHPVAVYLPTGDRPEIRSVAAKISHYGNYSYLVFDGVHNRLKGVWPAVDSPLQVNWPQTDGVQNEITPDRSD